ncbi:unnamed protein product [Diamesa serratosioi]
MKLKLLFFILVLSFLAFSDCLDCDDKENANVEVRLKKKLLCDYDADIRPGHSKNATIIRMNYIIKSYDYSETSQELTVTSWMTLSWNDDALQWKPSDYSNLTLIHESADLIWTPQLHLYNGNFRGSVSCITTDCLINSNSRISCVMPCEHTSMCSGDFTNWPMDYQNCSFIFGNWMKTGEEVNYQSERVKIVSKNVQENTSWKMLAATVRVNTGNYSEFKNVTFPSVKFTFVIERHSAMHIAGYIMSAFVLMIACLSVLWMTPGCVERFVLAGFNLFSHFLFVEQLVWLIPHNGETLPNVVSYFRDSMLIATFLLIETIVVKVIMLATEKPPVWIQSTTTFATNNKVGEFLFTSSRPEPQDSSELIEKLQLQSNNDVVWITFCRIIDRLIFLILFITFITLFILMLPRNYLSFNYNPLEVN